MSQVNVNPGSSHVDHDAGDAGMVFLGLIIALLILLSIVFYGPRMFQQTSPGSPAVPQTTAGPVVPAPAVPSSVPAPSRQP